MIQVLIFSLVLLLYWLLGFLPGRPIKPKKNRWHAYGTWDQVQGFIDGDRKSFLPKSMPPPFHKVYFTLTYNQFTDNDSNLTDHTLKSADGKAIHYHAVKQEDFIYGAKAQVRKVTEEMTRLRKTESHPYTVKVLLPKVGGTFYFIFTLKIKIKNPMKALDVDNFLVLIGNQLHDRFSPWAVGHEAQLFENVSNPNDHEKKLGIIDKLVGLSIDDDNSIMLKIAEPGLPVEEVNLRNYMNRVVAKYGGFIEDNGMDLDVGYDEKIKKILDTRNQQINQAQLTKLEEEKNLTRDRERARENADQLQLIALDKQELDDVILPELKGEADANEKANAAWKAETLILGDTKTSVILPRPKRKKQGGTNATT